MEQPKYAKNLSLPTTQLTLGSSFSLSSQSHAMIEKGEQFLEMEN